MRHRGATFIATLVVLASCASGHRDPFTGVEPLVRDPAALEARLRRAVSMTRRFEMLAIGSIEYDSRAYPVWCLSTRAGEKARFRVLVNGGVHGNEPAGAEAAVLLIERLARDPKLYRDIAFSVIPIVNPWGWSRDVRHNRMGRDINRDFASFKCRESRLIRDFIAGKRYDLIIDHHEDPDGKGFYMYQYGNPDASLSRMIIHTLRRQGHPIEQDIHMVILRTRDGLIDAPMWGLWYMRLTRQLSITNYFRFFASTRVYTLETPVSLPFAERIAMHDKSAHLLIRSLYGNEEKDRSAN